MKGFSLALGAAGILAATTVGAGMFALPYVFLVAGQGLGLFYLAALSSIVGFVHFLYWRTLRKLDERERLLGMVRRYLGKRFSFTAFLAIVGGLVLALVVYLILAGEFFGLMFPALRGTNGTLLFWALASLPLLLSVKRLVGFELAGACLMAGIILLILFTADRAPFLPPSTTFTFHALFLPFGAILFALAGWTAIEPMYEYAKGGPREARTAIAVGTLLAAFLYLAFVAGIFGGTDTITSDTISGLAHWQKWKIWLLGALGLFAIWTSYLPIGLEIRGALEHDLRWSRAASLTFVIVLPLVLVFAGFDSFFRVVSLAGGLFLGFQYLLIVAVSRKVLSLSFWERALSWALMGIFALGAVYELYYFVIQ